MTTAMRASDSDRQLVADRLADHHAAGRLSLSEYDERLAKAYSAVYRDDFRPLFADLPGNGPLFADAGDDGAADRRIRFGDGRDGGHFMRDPFGGVRDAADSLADAVRRPAPGRVHPAVLVLTVIGGLLLIGALIHALLHLVIPVLVIGAVVLFIGRRHGSRRGTAGARPFR